MRRAMAVLAGLAVLGVVASMTVASAERQPVAKNAWGVRSTEASELGSADARAGFGDGDYRIVVISRNEKVTEIDNPPTGRLSQGDRLTVFSPLFRHGRRIGRLDVDIVWTNANFQAGQQGLLITATSTLPQGQITATGVQTNDNFFKAAITGGTGRYDTVGGDVLVRFLRRAVRIVYDVDNLG